RIYKSQTAAGAAGPTTIVTVAVSESAATPGAKMAAGVAGPARSQAVAAASKLARRSVTAHSHRAAEPNASHSRLSGRVEIAIGGYGASSAASNHGECRSACLAGSTGAPSRP